MATKWNLALFITLLSLSFILFPVYCKDNYLPAQSFRMTQSDSDDVSADSELLSLFRSKRDAEVTETESPSEKGDKKCEAQKEFYSDKRKNLKEGGRLEETHVFVNDTKYNLALAWAGENDDGTLLVLTTDVNVQEQPVSTLWRSTDHGRTWANWTSHVDNKVFRKEDGLQRNPHNPRKVYLVSYEHFIYLTQDGGETWRRSNLTSNTSSSTAMDKQLEFHPESQFEDYVAIISDNRQLYVTYNNFLTDAEPIKSNVQTVKWGTVEAKTQKCLYATTKELPKDHIQVGPEMMNLERYDSEKDQWKTILQRVVLFNVEDKFIYASIFKYDNPKTQNDERLMMISTDGGGTWNQAQLPTLTNDRFFSVLDMSEGLIFMHVDNPGDTGYGTLYTSSSSGIVYAESLRNHLFPNYNTIHDFYKIASIRGVYLASQMNDDKSIHTVITYNRGAEWRKVRQPDGAKCQNALKGCNLQIHSAYSIHRGIKAQLPLSQKEASGLVLVHAHVANNLQTTPPDVYLSTDGGYNFKLVLHGPHSYEITDSGGLLVAVPLETDYPKVVKFSTDEGNCWHTYKFTSDDIKFTGLLTEPGGRSMTVGLWGYHKDTKKWTISVIDFSTVVTRECKKEDYTSWMPHTSLTARAGYEGCLLGKKETFQKIKQDSWCRNGYSMNINVSTEICKCTEEDYECDYGFYRPDNSVTCVRQPEITAEQIDICRGTHLEKLKTLGYRLIPGDVCDPVNGFHPVSEMTELDIICSSGDQQALNHNFIPVIENTGSSKAVIAAVLIIILLLVAVVGALFIYKMVLLKRHRMVYRYSMLTQADERDNEMENALTSHDTLYSDSSDDEVEQDSRLPKQNGAVPLKTRSAVKPFHDDSDEEMLD